MSTTPRANAPVITIDGPSGSGKGTVSRQVAKRLGWHFLDSGALYRLVALAALRRGLFLEDEQALAALASALDVRFAEDGQRQGVVLFENQDVTDEIRSQSCGQAASRVAALPAVRSALLARQRTFRTPPGLVADGRDMGTTVFPHAELKIFLTASREERAKRRYKQLKEKGRSVTLRHILNELAERDQRDSQRPVSPLKPAADARVIDSTRLSIEEAVETVLAEWARRARSGL
ncbi:MAG TPA: (d)CMP kinase [Gammaproteobacteria bacterium]|nr:(d)CMP kinase [Gammaproteobacteria bacterium]